MFACICRAVTCDQVTTAIDSGAVTVRAVAKATGACTGCGTCLERIVGMIDERATTDAPCPLAAAHPGHLPLTAQQAPATAMAATQAA